LFTTLSPRGRGESKIAQIDTAGQQRPRDPVAAQASGGL
jgi:hypothetical protein